MRSCLFLLSLLLFISFGCKKPANPDMSMPSYLVIDYTGVRLPGSPLVFSSNVGSGKRFLWDFGDGITSTEAKPTHAYSTPGNYVLKLSVGDSLKKWAKKMIYISNDPGYTKAASGTKNCRHFLVRVSQTLIGGVMGVRHDTIKFPDVTFEVKYIDVVTIAIGNVILPFEASQGSFVHEHTNYALNWEGITETYTYNDARDSASYVIFDDRGASTYSWEYFCTK